MKRHMLNAAMLAWALSAMILSGASRAGADPVDLSDKKGIVDPADLKKYDPKHVLLADGTPPPPPPPPPAVAAVRG